MSALTRLKGRLCSLLFCGALCSASLAEAQAGSQAVAPNIEVEWRAPAGCPDRDALLRSLHERLRERQVATELRAFARVVRSATGFRLELELVSPAARAKRHVSDAQCAPLAEAAAVLIALAVQSQAAQPESEPEPPELEPEPESEPEKAAAPPATSAPTRAASTPNRAVQPRTDSAQRPATTSAPKTSARDREREATPELELPARAAPSNDSGSALRLQLSAAARAGLGTFPHQPALGMQAQLAARIAALYLAVGVTYWPPLEQNSSSYPNARLRGSGIFSDVSVGFDVATRPLVLTGALQLELGQLDATAQGIAGPQSNRTLWLATGPAAAAGITFLDDWTVALELAGLIPLYRTHWLVRTPTADASAFVAAQVSWRLALRLSYVLPL